MVSPSGRVPEWAPDWFFVATEACGGETPDLGFFLGVFGFIGVFGIDDSLAVAPESACLLELRLYFPKEEGMMQHSDRRYFPQ